MIAIKFSRAAAAAFCFAAIASAEPSSRSESDSAAAFADSAPAVGALAVSDDQAIAEPDRVCTPDSSDDKPALRSDCITVLEDVAKRKGRYAATTRHKRELRSLCENQWLPRCRHKY